METLQIPRFTLSLHCLPCLAYGFFLFFKIRNLFFFKVYLVLRLGSPLFFPRDSYFAADAKFWCVITCSLFPLAPIPPKHLPSHPPSPFVFPFVSPLPSLYYLSRVLELVETAMMLQQCRAAGKGRS